MDANKTNASTGPGTAVNPFHLVAALKIKMGDLAKAVESIAMEPKRGPLRAAERAIEHMAWLVSALQEFEVAYRAN